MGWKEMRPESAANSSRDKNRPLTRHIQRPSKRENCVQAPTLQHRALDVLRNGKGGPVDRKQRSCELQVE